MRRMSGVTGDALLQRLTHNATPTSDGETTVHGIAATGMSGPGQRLPFAAPIQRAFGHHAISDVQAHVGGPAWEACQSLGAAGYAMNGRVAFKSAPDLHTAAHEAAHVIQQRKGVSLKGGVGRVGDPYEQHADAVADAVVEGRSAQTLLDQGPSSGIAASSGQVQRKEDAAPSAQGDPKVKVLSFCDLAPTSSSQDLKQLVHLLFEVDPGFVLECYQKYQNTTTQAACPAGGRCQT
ncbi:MAG: DUF4157 domain-containing protein [Myxococcota bacterium]